MMYLLYPVTLKEYLTTKIVHKLFVFWVFTKILFLSDLSMSSNWSGDFTLNPDPINFPVSYTVCLRKLLWVKTVSLFMLGREIRDNDHKFNIKSSRVLCKFPISCHRDEI